VESGGYKTNLGLRESEQAIKAGSEEKQQPCQIQDFLELQTGVEKGSEGADREWWVGWDCAKPEDRK